MVAPTGIYRPADPKPASAPTSSDGPLSSFCTYIFSRDRLSTPLIALTGLEDPSVAVRFSPVLYKLVRVPGEKTAQSMIPGAYRWLILSYLLLRIE